MSKLPTGLNDIAWMELFSKHNIINNIEKNGFFEISAKQINEFREARLMTKFDNKNNLPRIFQNNKLSILPITRGSYVISNFEAYHRFESASEDVIKVTAPDFIQSIDFENITSESTAVNVAYLSGILNDFTGEELLLPTVNGRMSSDKFDFKISKKLSPHTQRISVANSQIEIDGGFEGVNSLTLIEAKNYISDDFLVRQLYYPYRLWCNKINKPVKPVFLTYSNGIFSLYEYTFNDLNHYNSLILIKQKNYTLEKEEIELDDIIELSNKIKSTNEPNDIPFPQADSFKRIINICELLNENEFLTREEITSNYDFDIRQTNYYTDAARYLGLVTKEKTHAESIKYCLTEKGNKIFKLNLRNRNIAFAKCILEKRIFNEAFKEYLKNCELPSRSNIVRLMKTFNLNNIASDSTYNRRASTIFSWINWILDLCR